ncbi:hypothetical protein HNQ71_006852 [Mesorhizobium sangaii]|uniref:Uncharacterized protein n=1 Tax=Mesorhizobium sangaii TaxID=505389 RepID=A0A841PKJ2_9HYPH|nr:hypothetical protein [Mesorhizobium sangaii]
MRSDALSSKEVPVPAIHERMAAVNGAADAVTQIVARIFPVGLDRRLADQRFHDFPVRSPRKRTVERLKDEAEAATARFRRKQGRWQSSVRGKTVETLKCPQPMLQLPGGPDCVEMKSDGQQKR